MTTTYTTLLLDVADGVATITLNRPEKKNAMNPVMHVEMTELLEDLRTRDDVGVVVFTGAGNSFCAGMDLKEYFQDLKEDPREYERITRLAAEWRGRTIQHFPKPTIAMINGYCFGGAMTIVESCDLAIASDDAKFGLSEINYKMFPGGSVSKALGRLLRPRDYMFYALTGNPFDGKVAADIGLINYSVSAEELVSNVSELASELASKDSSALRAVKDTYRFSLNMEWDAAMSYSTAMEAWHVQRQGDAFRKEGIGDFLGKKFRPGLEAHEKTVPSQSKDSE